MRDLPDALAYRFDHSCIDGTWKFDNSIAGHSTLLDRQRCVVVDLCYGVQKIVYNFVSYCNGFLAGRRMGVLDLKLNVKTTFHTLIKLTQIGGSKLKIHPRACMVSCNR